MDKHDKPLHHMTRMDAIDALRQCRSELLETKQQLKDVKGALEALTAVQEVPNELLANRNHRH